MAASCCFDARHRGFSGVGGNLSNSPRSTSALPPGGLEELAWDGVFTLVPSDLSSTVSIHLPVLKEGSGAGGMAQSKHHQESLEIRMGRAEQGELRSCSAAPALPPAPLAAESLLP